MDSLTGLTVTPALAAVLGLMLAALSLHVIRLRYRERVSLGDGGSPDLLRAIRAQANFAEHAPLTLVLLMILEINRAEAAVLYGLGAALVLGRCLHAFGVSRTGAHFLWRTVGMILTFAALIGASLRLAAAALGA
ncbi:MAG: MAPEG family protein [Rhodospirillales bacterium]